MKKQINLALAAMILMAAFALHAQEAPKVKLEKIFTFEKEAKGNTLPAVQQVLEEKAKGVPQEDVEWAFSKMKYDMIRKTRKMYTNNGSEVETPEFFQAEPHSYNYKYFILNTCDYNDGSPKNSVCQLIRTLDGNVMWKNKTMLRYAHISNNGAYVLDYTPKWMFAVFYHYMIFKIFNNEGILIKCIDDLAFDDACISNDGNSFVINGRGKVVAFDKRGNELWKTQQQGGEIKMSFYNNSKYLVSSSFRWNADSTLIADDKGKVVAKFHRKVNDGRFTNDSKLFIFNVAKDSVLYLNIKNGKIFLRELDNSFDKKAGYWFMNLSDSTGIEGVAVLDSSGVRQGAFVNGGEVSPNNYFVTIKDGIYLLKTE